MTDHGAVNVSAVTRSLLSKSSLVAAAAMAAGLVGVLILAQILAALPHAGATDMRAVAPSMGIPSAQADGTARGDTSVPDAAKVFSGREGVVEEPAPTF